MVAAMKAILTILLTATLAHAADLGKFAEGDAKLRARLEKVEGAKAPEIELADWMNSKALTLADCKGKIVVLDFWATWCGPCIASIPHNKELVEKYKDDVVFIGVCHPRGAEKMKQTADAKGITYPIAVDTDGKAAKAYEVNGFPDYYIIDRDGKVVLADCSNGSVGEALEALLKDK
jgi:cytochrome c biogenesis protein CcmG/thiol:disulfide interchange protein DsbE